VTSTSRAITIARPRRDFSDAALLRLVAVCAALIVVWFALRPWMPETWRVPGSKPLYLVGVAGTLLMLVPAAFALAKRAGISRNPVAWFNAHVWCACLGAVLIAIHSGGYLRRPPALLLLALLALAALGVWARLRGSRLSARTFGTAAPAFRPPDERARARLKAIIAEKEALLARLDPTAREATFSVTLPHWLRQPRLSAAYARLAQEETRLIGRREAVDGRQAWWRPLHLALAWLFVLGVLIHVVTVTFFAGYVAGDRPITWWYITAW
jgi:cytochrome b561